MAGQAPHIFLDERENVFIQIIGLGSLFIAMIFFASLGPNISQQDLIIGLGVIIFAVFLLFLLAVWWLKDALIRKQPSQNREGLQEEQGM